MDETFFDFDRYISALKNALFEFDKEHCQIEKDVIRLQKEYTDLKAKFVDSCAERKKLKEKKLIEIRNELVKDGLFIFVGIWNFELPLKPIRINYPVDTSNVVWGEECATGYILPKHYSLVDMPDSLEIYQKIIDVGKLFVVKYKYDLHKWIYQISVDEEVLIALDRETKTGTILVDIIKP
jgi:hypothetical protein